MNIMILAGAGTSVELGVPAMAGMAREFIDHSKQWCVEPELVQKIIGNTLDIEYLIDGLDKICSAASSLKAIGQNTEELRRVHKIRAEVEWFVQHAAERIVPKEAELMWGGILRSSSTHALSLITTNYDRAIELAANAVNVELNDGYNQFEEGELSRWNGFGNSDDEVVLAKLHGSTDWFEETGTKSAIKLRHPMPLFGNTRLQIAGEQELGSSLVLPSREKLLTHAPYPRLSQIFLNSADKCEIAIFMGTSLRDDHLRDAAISTAMKVPVFLVTPEALDTELENIIHIKQCASTFLISTLPNALATDNIAAYLTTKSVSVLEDQGIFQTLISALNASLSPHLRCQALEELEDLELAPNIWVLENLLEDENPQVARYALGLLSHSPHGEILRDKAKTSAHKVDNSFLQDLKLLEEMV
ncbi:MAG: SIR2 family protein [Candidatus Thiodiazotropha sp. (ex Lucinoma annulata)]|nr:SIR2 family protein [Candidatus Thiodiazotropha sp. (ex Lucinoma annulata)]